MIINETIGNIIDYPVQGKNVDYLDLEWFETTKRIQRKKTRQGIDLAIKFLREGQRLREGDVLYDDETKVIVVNVVETEAIVMKPASMLEMGTICYEIGNKHIPLFIQNDEVLLPFEMPMYRWLEASGFSPEKQNVKLLNLLKSNVEPHGHGSLGSTLFTKILKMAAPKDE
ncbi:urease accessory protein UreE [Chryseobacterium sp. T16E-39]|uniref:urease accessory protein UreE n=1 Tax=Chryseobacterium sp. T16E-39 TaxID=2015076 RepID=UPI000B5B2184|nr:urease accessory protein UreE [Chryseobacterium sp. T16E-39]ASK30063.1 urease accessory protein UreE [Chryseobacterium sp. T16E-39]